MQIKLQEPVSHNNKNYTTLTIGKFKAKHLKHIPKEVYALQDNKDDTSATMDVASKMLPLIASMCDVDNEVIEELSMTDFMEVVNKIGPFLEASQNSGINVSGQ